MTNGELLPRRAFLIDVARVAAAGWLTFDLQLLVACARDTSSGNHRFTHLTTAEARTLRAFATQILPSENGAPGAEEAGAAFFVDRAFGMPFFANTASVVRSGLADLDARANASVGRRDFASATDDEQVAMMRAIEETPFFVTTRTLVLIGTFADPSYGGNRNGAGWSLLGLEHRPSFAAPFGWYDAHVGPDASTGDS